jgi:glycosyltransferase involved in cell wall biosynthesis
MKLAAAYVIYDDTEYLEASVESIYKSTDHIFFLFNTKPWNGTSRPEDRVKAEAYLQEFVKKFPKCEIIEGTWNREHEQRNFGLELSKTRDCKFCVVVDTDEVYHPFEFENLKDILIKNQTVPAFHCSWNTYWKQKPLYQIEPRESFNPLIVANVDQFLFFDKRAGVTTDQYGVPTVKYACAYLPPHVLLLHHFSYARTDEYIKNKIQNFEHSHEIVPGWYEDVWLQFKPGNKYLNPTNPKQYMTAVEVNLNMLPKNVRTFLTQKK